MHERTYKCRVRERYFNCTYYGSRQWTVRIVLFLRRQLACFLPPSTIEVHWINVGNKLVISIEMLPFLSLLIIHPLKHMITPSIALLTSNLFLMLPKNWYITSSEPENIRSSVIFASRNVIAPDLSRCKNSSDIPCTRSMPISSVNHP